MHYPLLTLCTVSPYPAAAAYTSLASVLASAQGVTSLVDQDKVARELGVNTDKDDVLAVASRKDADTKKAALIDAYSAASSALLERVKLLTTEIEGKGDGGVTSTQGVIGDTSSSIPVGIPVQDPIKGAEETLSSTTTETATATPVPSSSSASPTPSLPPSSSLPGPTAAVVQVTPEVADLTEKRTQAQKEFDASCKQLQRWDDLNSDKHWLLCISRLKLKNQWGQALKKVNDLSSSSADNKAKGEPVSREVLYEVPGPTQHVYCSRYSSLSPT